MSLLRTLIDNLPTDLSDNMLDMTVDEVGELLDRVVDKAKQQEKERLDHMAEFDEDLFEI
jgi:hypothetical protein